MKKVFAIIAGVLAGIAIVFVGDATTHALHPPPIGLNYMDKNVMVEYIAGIPTYIMGIMVFFWLLAAFTGGLLAGLINKAQWRSSAMICGSILLAATLLNLVLMPHPLWMWVGALVGILPAAYLGAWVVNRVK